MKADHLTEIFGVYGNVIRVELHVDRRFGLSRGNASVEFEKPTGVLSNHSRVQTSLIIHFSEAEQAVLFLDGGQLDGKILKVDFVLFDTKRSRGKIFAFFLASIPSRTFENISRF